MYKITFYLLNIFGHNLSIYNIFKENTDLRLLIIVKIIKSSSLEAVIQSCQLRQELVYLYLQTQTLKLLQRLLLRGRAVIFSFWFFLHFNYSRMEPVTQQHPVSAKRHSHARQSKLCAASLMYVSREPSQVQAEYPCSTHKNRGKIPNPSRLELLDSGVR